MYYYYCCSIDLTLNWLLNVYDLGRQGQLRNLSFQVGLVIMCRGAAEDKFNCKSDTSLALIADFPECCYIYTLPTYVCMLVSSILYVFLHVFSTRNLLASELFYKITN